MSRKFKITARLIWIGLIILYSVLSFFGAPFPANWEGVLSALTSLDVWIINNAEYPGSFGIALGLLIGTVIIPGAWNWFYGRYLYEPKANMRLGAAMEYIEKKSRWAYVNRHARMPLPAIAADCMHRAASDWIKLWGTPHEGFGGRSLHFTGVEYEISPTHWAKHELDLDVIFDIGRDGFAETKRINKNDEAAKQELEFAKIRVDWRQIRRQKNWRRMRMWQRLHLRISKWRAANT